jgi:hypothetical protein
VTHNLTNENFEDSHFKILRKNHFDVALWGVAKYIVVRRGGW